MMRTLKLAVIAGEVSGDILGGDLVAALRRSGRDVELIGVGGDRLQGEGLKSLFDFSELSVMGIADVLAKLPSLIRRIRQTAEAIIAARPDALLIIDSPDFTHRVARRVRKALPDLPVIQYVCPSVWAWKEYRAQAMLDYVDLVLAVLPFEPVVMQRLGGPKTIYVGHRLAADPDILRVRAARQAREPAAAPTILLLPGSRSSEIKRLTDVMGEAVSEIKARHPDARFLLPAVARQEAFIRQKISTWTVQPECATGDAFKWEAFAKADAAIAASGTVILELAMAGVPAVSIYRTDPIIKFLASRIKVWTAALPNLIADYPVIPEYINELLRPGAPVRWVDRLMTDTPQRAAMLAGYADVWSRMNVEKPSGELAAEALLSLLVGRPSRP
ncbi:lipid-A-disaccharide synthase [Rhizobium sp. C4]|uniref:lipid-A-disaccharide synthase n=1 Tax=Rhizobium sp. C4 TaxID=1349800 RepID=UPI001E55C050|nr:lipid-A-disaccharide synthase [Rhizobium sp. C4]MCD2171452.1 lipid-A-disaccharide synthase [Rhizobium sp. C4]